MAKQKAKKEPQFEQKSVAYGNRFYVDKRDMKSPYMTSYYAAKSTGPVVAKQPEYFPRQENDYAGQFSQEVVPVESKKAKKAKTPKTSQKKVKRNFFVFLTAFLSIVLIAFLVVSFVGIEKIADYTSIAVKKTTIGEGEDAVTTVENISLKDIAMGTIESFKKKPAEEAEAAGEETEVTETEVTESYIYYTDRMENVKSLDMVGKMSAYGFPVGLVVFVLIVIVFMVRLLISLFTPKRRKFFILSSVLLLVLGIVINLFLYMWSVVGTDFSKIKDFVYLFAKDSALTIQASIGALVLIAVPLLMTITSIFCFRSKKKVGI